MAKRRKKKRSRLPALITIVLLGLAGLVYAGILPNPMGCFVCKGVQQGDSTRLDEEGRPASVESEWYAAMPQGAFEPLALLHERDKTHLIYLGHGAPQMVSAPGLIVLLSDQGLVQVQMREVNVPITTSTGDVVKVDKPSVVERIELHRLGPDETVVLHPKKVEPLVLDPADLTDGAVVRAYRYQERCTILTIHDGALLCSVHRTSYFGGAHPIEAIETIRLDLKTTRPVAPRFKKEDSASAATEYKSSDDCPMLHRETVGLRAPLGIMVPVAMMVGEVAACAGRVKYAWQPKDLRLPESLSLTPEVALKGSRLLCGKKTQLKEVVDVVPLAGLPAAIALVGPSRADGQSDAQKHGIHLTPFSVHHDSFPLGSSGPLIGSQPLKQGSLGPDMLRQLRGAFGLVD